MSGQTSSSNPTIADPYQYLQIIPNPNGTITRDPNRFPNSSPSPDPKNPTPVLSKDTVINQSRKTWVRIFLPRQTIVDSSSTNKLPLIVYFHGGGFINCSASSTIFHDFCSKMTLDLQFVVVSVDYRLAPEHRLPAAYDDAVEVLRWIKTTQEDWLIENVDYTRCFIMGSSAGANIAFHAGLCVSQEVDNLVPLKIKGLILHHPFIGGVQRTGSEMRLVDDPHLPQCVNDLMWNLALPSGVDRDHEYCNPMVDGGSKLWENLRLLGWKVLVTGCDGDPMIDRQMEFVNMLVTRDIKVLSHFSKGGYHVVELKEPSKAKTLLVLMKDFMFN
ncbi:unnamed protein product [Dovyalis caffra]|uniref:Alpha/beta hydrolase fold-3 domain-containing protein n=1 Tax=Dovyalis caffra TaxID=77055 RepID=A0AAV1RPG7_9ROSI|nr:unnamed protein product [Dovyalis caffra]